MKHVRVATYEIKQGSFQEIADEKETFGHAQRLVLRACHWSGGHVPG